MIGYLDAISTMSMRGYATTPQDYVFALLSVTGSDPSVAYAFAYDTEEMNKCVGTEREGEYFAQKRKEAETISAIQDVKHLLELMSESFRSEVQKQALNLKDYRFSGEETVQILNSLLKSRVDDLDSASVKDVVQLLKALTEQGALEVGDGGFSRHFVQIYPKFNALCTKCGREFDAQRGLGTVCPHCGQKYKWSSEENRFYPNVEHL